MPLKIRGNQAMRKYQWPMWPHTCSRVRAPDAKRLKYSERRKGLCASSSAVRVSNHSSFVMAVDYSVGRLVEEAGKPRSLAAPSHAKKTEPIRLSPMGSVGFGS